MSDLTKTKRLLNRLIFKNRSIKIGPPILDSDICSVQEELDKFIGRYKSYRLACFVFIICEVSRIIFHLIY